jgi:hypothetical protein
MRPYIGVSGFMSHGEVNAALDAFPECGRRLMVGVLVSAKTLARLPNKYPNRYPRPEDIWGILGLSDTCLNLIHFSSDKVPDRQTLHTLICYAGRSLGGFQFNGCWPSEPDRRWLINGGYRVVLQMRPDTVECIAADTATDVLLDGSGGRGLPLDVDRAREHLAKLDHFGIGLGVAGGLCAETLPAAAPLLREFAGLSIDAEGRLRDADDHLDMGKVAAYLRTAGEILGP